MMLGALATGTNFRGRTRELSELWRYLEHEHICFPGVRRLGKSSILERLREEAARHGLLAKRIDLSDITSARGFIARLDQRPEKTIKHFLTDKAAAVANWFRRIKRFEVGSVAVGSVAVDLATEWAPSWQAAADQLYARLHKQPLLILLDEFPKMLQAIIQRDPQEASQLLAWLRIWRQSTSNACRFVFTGSIGLQSLLERHDLGSEMNDCHVYPLGPFTRQEARELWRYFAATDDIPWQISDATIDHALGRIGWLSPYFLCLSFSSSQRAARERLQEPPQENHPRSIEITDVDDAYEKLLAERSRFHHWKNRLKSALNVDELDFCWALLTALSHKPEGLTLKQLSARLAKRETDPERRAERLQNLLILLNDEGYLSPPDAQGRVQFRSFLLRDWWSRNHV